MDEKLEYWAAYREAQREKRKKNLAKANTKGWTEHTPHHFSRDLLGHKLDWWPSSNKFMWKGKVMNGRVEDFIRKREKCE